MHIEHTTVAPTAAPTTDWVTTKEVLDVDSDIAEELLSCQILFEDESWVTLYPSLHVYHELFAFHTTQLSTFQSITLRDITLFQIGIVYDDFITKVVAVLYDKFVVFTYIIK